jgi:hypothetical protein
MEPAQEEPVVGGRGVETAVVAESELLLAQVEPVPYSAVKAGSPERGKQQGPRPSLGRKIPGSCPVACQAAGFGTRRSHRPDRR